MTNLWIEGMKTPHHSDPEGMGCDPPPQGPNPQAQGQWKAQASLHRDVIHEILHITVYLSIYLYIPVYTSLSIVYTGIYQSVQFLDKSIPQYTQYIPVYTGIYQSVHSIYRYIHVCTVPGQVPGTFPGT